MITEEEKEEIIALATERMLLTIPEVIGNLMSNHAALHKINIKFYTDHPEFADRKDIVQAVVEMIEGKNPLMKYEELLERATPEITRRLLITKDLDMVNGPKNIPTNFKDTDFSGYEIL